MAVADVDVGGCGDVQLTIAGRRQAPLQSELGMLALSTQIDHLLGVKLDTTPPPLSRRENGEKPTHKPNAVTT